MKNKTSLIQDKRTQEFITQSNAETLKFLEIVSITILGILIVRWTGKVLLAVFSRSVYIHKPNLHKVVVSRQHMLPPGK